MDTQRFLNQFQLAHNIYLPSIEQGGGGARPLSCFNDQSMFIKTHAPYTLSLSVTCAVSPPTNRTHQLRCGLRREADAEK